MQRVICVDAESTYGQIYIIFKVIEREFCDSRSFGAVSSAETQPRYKVEHAVLSQNVDMANYAPGRLYSSMLVVIFIANCILSAKYVSFLSAMLACSEWWGWRVETLLPDQGGL